MGKLKIYNVIYSSKTPVHNVLIGQIITRNINHDLQVCKNRFTKEGYEKLITEEKKYISRSINNPILFNCLTDILAYSK